MRRRLVIDVRKAFDSGIGTYIRAVVPRVIRQIGPEAVQLLVASGSKDRHIYVDEFRVERLPVSQRPLSLGEQFHLMRTLDANTLFWATSLAHPLYSRTPLVATVHDTAQLALAPAAAGGRLVQLASRVYLDSLRRSANGLLFNSAFTRDEFQRLVGTSCASDTITPLGVDSRWFEAPSATVCSRPYFICVGNIRPHKNLRTLFAAFAAVQQDLEHDLVVVGQQHGFRTSDSGFEASLGALGARVRFLGHVSEPELRKTVAGACALVFPSLYEGFGLPALEAMACGCVVIAASAGALPEVCGDVALYFDPNAPQELARLLKSVAVMPQQDRALRRMAGIERAASFTWERTAALTVEVLLRELSS